MLLLKSTGLFKQSSNEMILYLNRVYYQLRHAIVVRLQIANSNQFSTFSTAYVEIINEICVLVVFGSFTLLFNAC